MLSVKKSLQIIIGLAFVLCGAGCQKTTVHSSQTAVTSIPTIPVAPAVTSTPSINIESTSTASDPNYRQFSGSLFSDAPTMVYLTFSDGQWTGRYVNTDDGHQGSVYQSGNGTEGDTVVLGFADAEAGQQIAIATSTWSSDHQVLTGEIQPVGEPSHEFTLQPYAANTGAVLQTVAFQKNWDTSSSTSCEFDMVYPQIVLGQGIPDDIANKINTQIHDQILGSAVTTTESAAENYLAACKQNLADLEQSAGTSTFMTRLDDSQSNAFEVSMNQDGILSLILTNYEFNGSPNGDYGDAGLIFDLKTGDILTLKDLVDPAHLRDFMQYETRQLLVKDDQNIFDDQLTQFKTFIKDTSTTTTAGQLATFGNVNNFYLTTNALVMVYNPYEVTPYAFGIQEIVLPYSDWSTDRLAPSILDQL